MAENTVKTPWYPYTEGVPVHLEYFKGSMFDMVASVAARYPNYVAFDFMGKSTTYAKMIKKIEQCAQALKTIGIRKGDCVTIAMPNCPQAIYMFYAINLIGGIASMVHPLSSEKEIEFYLNESNSITVITLDQFYGKIEAIRKEYTDEYAVAFSGSTVCPYCGSDLPDKMVDELRQKFASEKKSRLDAITARGKSKSESISRIEAEIDAGGKRIAELEAGILEARKSVETLDEVLAKIPEPEMPEIRFEDNAEWSGLEERKARLRESMPDASVDLSDLQEKLTGLDKERFSLVKRMSKKSIIEKFDKEVESLNARGRELSQMIADIEKEESLITALTRKKIEICESRVNSMFSLVRFRLYTYTNDGNPVETCIPLVDGVPYGTANTARRINAGLDIINALQKHFGTSVPVFLDNRERVNEVLPVDAQTIHMFVTSDKELIIK